MIQKYAKFAGADTLTVVNIRKLKPSLNVQADSIRAKVFT